MSSGPRGRHWNARGIPIMRLRWLTEPPPWPPASVARMITGAGEHGMSMVETLAGQLATEPRSGPGW